VAIDCERKDILETITAEVAVASVAEARAYLHGAARDGTVSRNNTLRISQSEIRWLHTLRDLLGQLGKRSWIYREGRRRIWVLESTWRDDETEALGTVEARVAFCRGYFDAEGGVPRALNARFYIQLVQKDFADLSKVKRFLEELGVRTGRLHNPSVAVDPDYWRFFVRSVSHADFAELVGSWHPRKRQVFEARFPKDARLLL
jgi:hypothetical protein